MCGGLGWVGVVQVSGGRVRAIGSGGRVLDWGRAGGACGRAHVMRGARACVRWVGPTSVRGGRGAVVRGRFDVDGDVGSGTAGHDVAEHGPHISHQPWHLPSS